LEEEGPAEGVPAEDGDYFPVICRFLIQKKATPKTVRKEPVAINIILTIVRTVCIFQKPGVAKVISPCRLSSTVVMSEKKTRLISKNRLPINMNNNGNKYFMLNPE
jgi:hypothetical protein